MSTKTQPANQPIAPLHGHESDAEGAIARSQFMAAVVAMSWQLALVVLIPTIGGSMLDKHFGTSPWLTLMGLVIAVAGAVLIVWRMARMVTPPTGGARG